MARHKGLFGFLGHLPQEQVEELYDSKWGALAAFRALPAVGKQVVLKLLPLPEDAQDERLRSWAAAVTPASGPSALGEALQNLHDHGILTTHAGGAGKPPVQHLHRKLRENLLVGLAEGPGAQADTGLSSSAPDSGALAQYAQERWESLMLFLINDEQNAVPEMPDVFADLGMASLDARALLEAAGLRTVRREGTLLDGYDRRFAFLMQPPAAQMWQVVRGYVSMVAGPDGLDAGALVTLLLHISFLEPGMPRLLSGFSPAEQQAIAHLCQLGLLLPLQTGRGPGFCATHLAAVLGGSDTGLGYGYGGAGVSGWIVMETNFRVYAYTSSRIHQNVLRQFCRPDCILPNLFVGTITFKSLDDAFNRGLDAASIINYLAEHAHPGRPGSQRVPEAVCQQIELWERSMRRVQDSRVVSFHNFEVCVWWDAA